MAPPERVASAHHWHGGSRTNRELSQGTALATYNLAEAPATADIAAAMVRRRFGVSRHLARVVCELAKIGGAR